jgi:Fur family transcriptional regulator, ferric uptake regulator
VLVEQPRAATAHMHRLEHAVAAQDAEVVRPQDRNVGGHRAYAEHSYNDHAGEPNTMGAMASDPLADALRERGLRLTAQRQFVLDAVHRLGHATPDQVHARVAETAAGVNITTVYRTLELLEDLGLVTHTHLSHGAPTYHAAAEEPHVHLVCRDCGGIDEVAPSILDGVTAALRRSRGFQVDVGHVSFFGRCTECAS